MAPGVHYSALLVPQHIFLPPAHHIDGGGQDAPLGKTAQGCAQHSKDDWHRDSPHFRANIRFYYAVSIMHSTASVTTNPNSVHCISIHSLIHPTSDGSQWPAPLLSAVSRCIFGSRQRCYAARAAAPARCYTHCCDRSRWRSIF